MHWTLIVWKIKPYRYIILDGLCWICHSEFLFLLIKISHLIFENISFGPFRNCATINIICKEHRSIHVILSKANLRHGAIIKKLFWWVLLRFLAELSVGMIVFGEEMEYRLGCIGSSRHLMLVIQMINAQDTVKYPWRFQLGCWGVCIMDSVFFGAVAGNAVNCPWRCHLRHWGVCMMDFGGGWLYFACCE